MVDMFMNDMSVADIYTSDTVGDMCRNDMSIRGQSRGSARQSIIGQSRGSARQSVRGQSRGSARQSIRGQSRGSARQSVRGQGRGSARQSVRGQGSGSAPSASTNASTVSIRLVLPPSRVNSCFHRLHCGRACAVGLCCHRSSMCVFRVG